MTNQQLWQAVLGELELQISKPNFTTWFKNTFILDREEDKVIIGVANTFTKIWLEKKYHDLITKALRSVSQDGIKEIIYKVENRRPNEEAGFFAKPDKKEKGEAMEAAAYRAEEVDSSMNKYGLNAKYTFENFIVGKENELAQAACLAVASKLGQAYNPLFIYGGAGLGKTHLIQAIGHQILRHNAKKKVLYATCESFTNEFIKSVRNGKANEFKDTYRLVDLLMVDDVQFLAGKEGTQEEFFHTFNALHQNNKQIVICSDRPPKAIAGLESRLLSRFEWGMIADVNPPSLETRMAILESNCKKKNFYLKQDVVEYIASNIQNNIRELEGALNRIIAYHQLNNTNPDLESAKRLLASIATSPRQNSITTKQLITLVANFFEISIEELVGQSRKKELVVPRQIVMYLMREEMKSSFPNIGQELGGRDHTTAIHACLKINNELKTNEKIRKDVELIRQKIHN